MRGARGAGIECRRKANSFGLVGIEERISALTASWSSKACGKRHGLIISIPLDDVPFAADD
jgi:glucose-6-phosphate-specific signal transduction histidine kinase